MGSCSQVGILSVGAFLQPLTLWQDEYSLFFNTHADLEHKEAFLGG